MHVADFSIKDGTVTEYDADSLGWMLAAFANAEAGIDRDALIVELLCNGTEADYAIEHTGMYVGMQFGCLCHDLSGTTGRGLGPTQYMLEVNQDFGSLDTVLSVTAGFDDWGFDEHVPYLVDALIESLDELAR